MKQRRSSVSLCLYCDHPTNNKLKSCLWELYIFQKRTLEGSRRSEVGHWWRGDKPNFSIVEYVSLLWVSYSILTMLSDDSYI